MKPFKFVLLSSVFCNATATRYSRSLSCPVVSLDATTNIWAQYSLQPNPYYREQVLDAANSIRDPNLKKKALRIADVGTFFWLSTPTDLDRIPKMLEDVPCNHIVGIVLQGMHSQANCTSPKFKAIEPQTYKKAFVDPLATIIKSHPTTAFALILEPSSLPSVIIHSDLSSCAPLISTYRTNIPYALQTLNLPNVITYLDAGHGGNLGWDNRLAPTAKELSLIYTSANRPSQLRGIAANTANYNSWDLAPGEFETSREIWPANRAQNEQKYVRLLSDLLAKAGVPNHAVVDTSRNGVQGLRYDWLDWCNVDGAGFGRRPGAVGGALNGHVKNELADAFIWAVGGGVSDGTSDESEDGYDEPCGRVDAYKPSPGRGEWNQGYFEMLLREARPEIA
ncbi:1, 4-beta cellobiohydrolase [Cladorrhinum sp. PSN332]|nr:1, 4-beta cellobiohydrolase [Cladorrhinum sp. PSN332]